MSWVLLVASSQLKPIPNFYVKASHVRFVHGTLTLFNIHSICRAIDDSLKSIKVFFVWLYGGTI